MANSLGGGAERRCGTCSAHAKLNCGLEHAQAGLRRCSALSLWAAWAADLQAFLLAPLALTVAAGVQAVCASAAPRWVTGIDRVDSVAPLLSVLSGLPGLVVVLGRGRRVGGCWCAVRSSGGRGRLCVWRRNALALHVSWLSYTYSVQLLSDGALKSPAARPCDTDSCSLAVLPRTLRAPRVDLGESWRRKGAVWGQAAKLMHQSSPRDLHARCRR